MLVKLMTRVLKHESGSLYLQQAMSQLRDNSI